MKDTRTTTQSTAQAAIGRDGMITLLISNLVLLLGFGLLYGWLLYNVIATARRSSSTVSDSLNRYQAILVAGLKLKNNQPDHEYRIRLKRVVHLLSSEQSDGVPVIILLGGVTGKNTLSEATAGYQYLQQLGVPPKSILCEDHSRHTLENLHHARRMIYEQFGENSQPDLIIISSRYHLQRIVTLAKGLNLKVTPVAAEQRWVWTSESLFKVALEAYFLHWYWCGKGWVSLTGNKHSRNRIS